LRKWRNAKPGLAEGGTTRPAEVFYGGKQLLGGEMAGLGGRKHGRGGGGRRLGLPALGAHR